MKNLYKNILTHYHRYRYNIMSAQCLWYIFAFFVSHQYPHFMWGVISAAVTIAASYQTILLQHQYRVAKFNQSVDTIIQPEKPDSIFDHLSHLTPQGEDSFEDNTHRFLIGQRVILFCPPSMQMQFLPLTGKPTHITALHPEVACVKLKADKTDAWIHQSYLSPCPSITKGMQVRIIATAPTYARRPDYSTDPSIPEDTPTDNIPFHPRMEPHLDTVTTVLHTNPYTNTARLETDHGQNRWAFEWLTPIQQP